MGEGAFLSDDMTGPPPLVEVRMGRFGHEDVAETLSILSDVVLQRFGHRTDVAKFANKVVRKIDNAREDVAERTPAGAP
jgi:hypothetical protein